MISLRNNGCSIGNEHGATAKNFVNIPSSGKLIDYDPDLLEEMLRENILVEVPNSSIL